MSKMMTTTMKKHRITGLKSLRRQKAALKLEIDQQQADIINDVEAIVWPFHVFRKYRRAAENIADNKFFVIGMQFAQSILKATWKRKKENEEHEEYGIADFLKQVADEFLSGFSKKDQPGEKD